MSKTLWIAKDANGRGTCFVVEPPWDPEAQTWGDDLEYDDGGWIDTPDFLGPLLESVEPGECIGVVLRPTIVERIQMEVDEC